VDVKVDEAGQHQPVAGIDHLLGGARGERIAELDDPAPVEAEIATSVKPLVRVDDGATADQHAGASMGRSTSGRARVIAGRS
jgi:hypothetical protein